MSDSAARMLYYKSESDKVVKFFDTELKPRILATIDAPASLKFKLELTGSHRSGLAYPARSFEDKDNKDAKDGEASDLDFAFVADNLADLWEVQRLFVENVLIKNKLCGDASLDSKQPHGLSRSTFFMGVVKTKAGLPWIPATNCTVLTRSGEAVLINKLDCTFRTTKQHDYIQTHVETEMAVKFKCDQDKVMYIEMLRSIKTAKAEFLRAGDQKSAAEREDEYMKAKKWLVCSIPTA